MNGASMIDRAEQQHDVAQHARRADARRAIMSSAPAVEEAHLEQRERQHEDEEHHRDRRAIAGAEETEALRVHRVEQHLGRLVRPALGQHRDGVEHLEERMAMITSTNIVVGPSIGQVTRAELLPGAVGAVDRGGLVEVARDRLQAGQEQHHVEADRLPDADGGQREQRRRDSSASRRLRSPTTRAAG